MKANQTLNMIRVFRADSRLNFFYLVFIAFIYR